MRDRDILQYRVLVFFGGGLSVCQLPLRVARRDVSRQRPAMAQPPMSSIDPEEMTEKSTEVAPRSTGDAYEDDLLAYSDTDGNEGEVLSD